MAAGERRLYPGRSETHSAAGIFGLLRGIYRDWNTFLIAMVSSVICLMSFSRADVLVLLRLWLWGKNDSVRAAGGRSGPQSVAEICKYAGYTKHFQEEILNFSRHGLSSHQKGPKNHDKFENS